MLRSEKKQSVSDLELVCRDSSSIFVTHYRGMTVAEVYSLKQSLKAKSGRLKVVKNTLVKIAAKNVGRNELMDMLSGPVAIVYSNDPTGTAKVLDDFAQKNEKLKILGGSVDGQMLSSSEVSQIAKLPPLDGLRAMLIALIQTPATNIAKLLNTPAQMLARVSGAYANKE